MAFDGITVAALVHELDTMLTEGHIKKIAQPESDELFLTIQTPPVRDSEGGLVRERGNYKLKLSANASLPLVYLTDENKQSPLTAPNFCMLLRKHLSGATITKIKQSGLERVIHISLKNRNELGDMVSYTLNIELMGKHSNIIFVDEKNEIIDSIKHVNGLMSSVREVLPGREYFIPNTLEKTDAFDIDTKAWNDVIFKKPTTVSKAISGCITGFSRTVAYEIAYRAGVDGDDSFAALSGNKKSAIMDSFRDILGTITSQSFSPVIYYDGDIPKEFSAIPLTMYDDLKRVEVNLISDAVRNYYSEKDKLTRIKSRSSDLTAVIKTNIERCAKKIDLLQKQLKDTEKKDKYKVYGELVTTYGYSLDIPVSDGADTANTVLKCTNHYDGKEIEIPIDPTLSVSDNANKYFDRYNKLKRTFTAVSEQLESAEEELKHLDSILNSLSIARSEEDINAIRRELAESGYIHKAGKNKGKKNTPTSKPLHYISSEGYDIYVGKNNYQNEEITFKLATGNDWWFHAKKTPGSHVVVKAGDTELPDSVFEEAAALAAFFSKGRGNEKLEIDYLQKKNVKKPAGGKPGFVIYYTNYSMMASEKNLENIKPADKEAEEYLWQK
ncbi:MAG: NFACT family protein [Eubacterium sp.]|nr:NFACT family protein [Eubacterium sp.]